MFEHAKLDQTQQQCAVVAIYNKYFSLNTQSCIKRLLVVQDSEFWAVLAARAILLKYPFTFESFSYIFIGKTNKIQTRLRIFQDWVFRLGAICNPGDNKM